ncbi:tRNA dihydrouridine synthase DusB [Kamptonema cortianum]|nr:tRNA dihydrouridine synthase DusB [Geitlerinema splendidum]MDK3160389.1 tRNA dihydrouridine synthase DusB [Kamptonema cortianum]
MSSSVAEARPAFHVGSIPVDVPLVLAPMEDVSNLAFRLICKRIGGPGLMFTEFVSAMAIHYGAAKTLKKMRIEDGERPLGIQIFGAEPDVMAETARVAEEMGADIVDINMGCWVPKVCRTGSGAALLKDPKAAQEIVTAVVKAVKVPVTVKVRAGWDYSQFAAPELAARFQDAGAQMLTLHARFAKQGFEGEADWKLIQQLREVLSIPLIGNGDVKTPEDATRMLAETGCDGVMVGRAAISNPWAMARIRAGLLNQPIPSYPTIHERVAIAIEHAKMMVEHEFAAEENFPSKNPLTPAEIELRGIRALRGQLPLYIKGEPGASQIRGRLSTVCSLAELEDILHGFLSSLEHSESA